VKLVLVEVAVKLPVGEIVNQLLLVQLCSETAAVALTLVCAVTPSVCEAGAVPAAIALNVKLGELKESEAPAAAVISRVILKVRASLPDVTCRVLVYLPAASPAGFTPIVNTDGVTVLLSDAVTQVALSFTSVRERAPVPVRGFMVKPCVLGISPPT
jgi:hypothetical protein